MDERLLIALLWLLLNGATFVVYGIDKFKARKSRWRIPERTLLLLAVLGGSVGAWMAMYIFHHKTLHLKFRFGVPVILLCQLLLCAWMYKCLLHP